LVPSGTEASFGARETIKKMYREDLLKDHRPSTFTPELVDKADLILVMDKHVLNATTATLPANKTHLLKEFFLQQDDDIVDPYQEKGERDQATLRRYEACADELRRIISTHLDGLLKALDAV
jgi:protein-tyrosine-phosphatase